MKKLLTILSLFLTAFSTLSVMPPGWYQQTLPVNDFVNDIYFVDTLTGWVVTQGTAVSNDTAYIMKTTNGGDNWQIQYARNINLTTVQFVNSQTGYVGGGSGNGTVYMFKTTNAGTNWIEIVGSIGGTIVDDMYFINADTGWYCDVSVVKTTDGGLNWTGQGINGTRVFFINKDTGWVGATDNKLYRTTNGGGSWSLQNTFAESINDIYFFDNQKGCLTSGTNFYTTNGGSNWIQCTTNVGGVKISFANDTIGWAGSGFNKISKTTNGGITWFYESVPIFTSSKVSVPSYNRAWAGGSGLIRTDGLTAIGEINNDMPHSFKLLQNYPNPFNPITRINYELRITNYIRLFIHDISGKLIEVLVDQKQKAGTYQYTFDGSGLSSGVYFYTLQTENFTQTKKMLLLK